MENRPTRRPIFFLRNLIVPGSAQGLLLVYNVITIFVTAVFFMLANVFLQTNPNQGENLPLIIGTGFALFLFLFYLGFWISNKIAGPIYRFEQHMQSILDGKPVTPFRIRADDQFQKTAWLYNELLKRIPSTEREPK